MSKYEFVIKGMLVMFTGSANIEIQDWLEMQGKFK